MNPSLTRNLTQLSISQEAESSGKAARLRSLRSSMMSGGDGGSVIIAPGPVVRQRLEVGVEGEEGVLLRGVLWTAPQSLEEERNSFLGDKPLVVFVHQYSKMGGCGELMCGMAKKVAAAGFPAITFDMRGAGRSTGSCTIRGFREVNDVVAVCKWASKSLGARNILLVGSSAGAPIAGSAVDLVPEITGFVAIGYVFGFFASILFSGHYSAVLKSKKPKLFVLGDSDGFTSVSTFNSYFEKMQKPKRREIVPGVGHFDLEGPYFDDHMMHLIVDFINEFLMAVRSIPSLEEEEEEESAVEPE